VQRNPAENHSPTKPRRNWPASFVSACWVRRRPEPPVSVLDSLMERSRRIHSPGSALGSALASTSASRGTDDDAAGLPVESGIPCAPGGALGVALPAAGLGGAGATGAGATAGRGALLACAPATAGRNSVVATGPRINLERKVQERLIGTLKSDRRFAPPRTPKTQTGRT
jgi:hypothetical protein